MRGHEPVNILLVDDQPAKLLSYEVILGELGENLIRAGSAKGALEQLLKTEIAVVVTDVSMPEVDGFELAAMIREHPRYQSTAIIFVSAIHLTDGDLLRGYESGAVDYVPVPVVPELLRAKVKVFAELYRKTRQLEQLNAELERRVAERTAALTESMGRLRESAAQFRAVFNQQFQFMALLSPDGRLIEVNDLPIRATGVPREAVLGRLVWDTPWWDGLPEMRSAWPGRLAAAARAGGPVLSEDQYLAHGEVRSAECTITAVKAANGKVNFFIYEASDITERKRAEEARRKSEALASAVHAAALDAVITIDDRGMVVEWNRAAEQVFGYSRAEAVGREMAELIIPPRLHDAHRHGMAHYLASGEGPVLGRLVELPALRADGTEFPVDLYIAPIPIDGPPLFTGFARDITERKRAEAALKENAALAEQITKIAASAPGVIYSIRRRPDGRMSLPYAAPNLMDVYGFEPEQVREDASLLIERLHPDDVEHVNATVEESARVMTPWHDEWRYRHPAKGEIWLEGHSSPVSEPDGSIIWHGFVHDITARKRAEQTLAERNAQLLLAGTAAQVGSYVLDLVARRKQIAPGYAAIYGFPAETTEIRWDDWRERVHPDDLPRLDRSQVEAFAERRREHGGDYRIVRPDGQVRWIESRSLIVYDEQGQPRRDVGVMIDITERKRAEQALKEGEERLRFVTESATLGHWDWDIASGRLEWSPTCKRLFGIPEKERMSHERFLAALHPDDRMRTDQAVQACLEGKGDRDYDIEYRTLWPDGSLHWIHARGSAVFEANRAVRMAGIALDVTERKRAEEHVRFVMSELSHRTKNLMAVVQAIAWQTAQRSAGFEDFEQNFTQRIEALARSHDLLVNRNWEGVVLEDLVRAQLAPFLDSTMERLAAHGPALLLMPQGAQDLGLALHELATNASKYGALSVANGKIDIGWRIDGGKRFQMTWRETGGPAVRAPTHKGFGFTVITSTLSRAFNGEARLGYSPEGLTWELAAPIGHVITELSSPGRPHVWERAHR
jgi:PAS domain S-box-containing protein